MPGSGTSCRALHTHSCEQLGTVASKPLTPPRRRLQIMAKSFRLHRGAVAMNYSKILNNQHRLKGSYLTATHFMLFVSNIPGVTLSKSNASKKRSRFRKWWLSHRGRGGRVRRCVPSSSLQGKQTVLDGRLRPAYRQAHPQAGTRYAFVGHKCSLPQLSRQLSFVF